jgi:predicted house-cleaning noncanonical NTP pyrophosphatase (MazG superfamily)
MIITQKNKLVRNNVIDDIESQGRKPNTSTLDDDRFQTEIFNKLADESKEVIESQNNSQHLSEEIADVYEVLDSIIKFKKLNPDAIKKLQNDKRDKWGNFDKKIWLESIIEKE